ncbi:MAG: hypothetical protein KF893_19395 [Caldilineaceae bacterium]|nr:hypothetical protein [Caldilineaceae bacterium]
MFQDIDAFIETPHEEFLALAATVGLAQAEILVRAPSTFLGEMYTGVAVRSAEFEAL